MKQIVTTTNRLRRKKTNEKLNSNDTLELSTNKLAPGILKVFGDNVSQGSNYKAVRASSISSAQEVVRIALERYGFEGCNTRDYILCDVIGEFRSNGEEEKGGKEKGVRGGSTNAGGDSEKVWHPIYIRGINNIEKPLVLQSLWKPSHGKFRRFELRKRADVDSSGFYINTSVSMGRRDSDISLFDYGENLLTNNSTPELKAKQAAVVDPDAPPSDTPYLLLLRGYDPNDKLVHKLNKATTIVGPYKHCEEKQHDVVLYAKDIRCPVCYIYKKVKMDEKQEINVDDMDFSVSIEPFDTMIRITVDGSEINEPTVLTPGQLVTFGDCYLFLFKDPTTVKDVNLTFPWLRKIKEVNGDFSSVSTAKRESTSNMVSSLDDSSGDSDAVSPLYARVVKKQDQAVQAELNGTSPDPRSDDDSDLSDTKITKSFQKSKLQLPYEICDEDDLLHTIIEIMDDEIEDLGVIPAYLFLMCVEHSASCFTEIQTRKLLLKISSGMQGIAWEKTKGVGKHADIANQKPMAVLRILLTELKVVLFWMTNALEMLHFLQCNLQKYLLSRNQVTTNQHVLLTADEELLSVLEDVIMFTFQQTIYHLTKVLHMSLPLLVAIKSEQTPTTEQHPSLLIRQVFEEILRSTQNLHIHPQIITQLFAYLFFFSNASLFNSLMEKRPADNFFTGDRGVQLKANVIVLEQWASENDLDGEYQRYMARFMCAVDLLATPATTLIPLEWKELRTRYSVLTPSQLQLLLGEYQLNGKQIKPRGWYPPPDEVDAAHQPNELLESFANHPPLVLPSSGFVVDLNVPPKNEVFTSYLSAINGRFEKAEETGSSGMDDSEKL